MSSEMDFGTVPVLRQARFVIFNFYWALLDCRNAIDGESEPEWAASASHQAELLARSLDRLVPNLHMLEVADSRRLAPTCKRIRSIQKRLRFAAVDSLVRVNCRSRGVKEALQSVRKMIDEAILKLEELYVGVGGIRNDLGAMGRPEKPVKRKTRQKHSAQR